MKIIPYNIFKKNHLSFQFPLKNHYRYLQINFYFNSVHILIIEETFLKKNHSVWIYMKYKINIKILVFSFIIERVYNFHHVVFITLKMIQRRKKIQCVYCIKSDEYKKKYHPR